jgi:hypothetical protein
VFPLQGLDVDGIAGVADHADGSEHRHDGSGRVDDFQEHAGLERLHFEVRFVGFDLEERVAAADSVAFFLEPVDDAAFGHALTGFWA